MINVVDKPLKIAFQHILQPFCPFYRRFKEQRGFDFHPFSRGGRGEAVGKACAFTGKLLVTETFRAQELRQFFFISANPEEKYDGV